MATNIDLTTIIDQLKASLLASPISTALLGLLIISTATWLLTSNGTNTPSTPSGKPTPSISLLTSLPTLITSSTTFLPSLRTLHPSGIFTLTFLRTRHNIIYTPSLATALLNQKSSHASNDSVSERFMRLNFGFPSREKDKYDAAVPDLMEAYKHISSEPWLGKMVEETKERIRRNVVAFVTGMGSLVDQMEWEKASDVRVVGDGVVEASLYPLILNFCAWTANPSLMGTDFLENNPEFLTDLWTLDAGFLLLATGLPRWFPWPALTRAHIARKKNLDRLDAFHQVLRTYWEGGDPGPKWSSLDDVGSLIKARMEIYKKHNFSIRARAACEHALMWAANANSNPLVFWMVCRIFEDRSLLAMIREEIAPYVVIKQEDNGLPISEPPRFEEFDVEGLTTKCPLLKSCYIECLRLDTGSWSFKTIQQDFVLQSREKDAQPWLLRRGDYAHVAHDLHNTDPMYFENPAVWRANRHVKPDGSADMGSIRPYGGGHSMCKGRAFALKETMMFSAAIVAMWDIETAGGGPVKIPRHRQGTGVYGAKDDVKVWIRRRKFVASRS